MFCGRGIRGACEESRPLHGLIRASRMAYTTGLAPYMAWVVSVAFAQTSSWLSSFLLMSSLFSCTSVFISSCNSSQSLQQGQNIEKGDKERKQTSIGIENTRGPTYEEEQTKQTDKHMDTCTPSHKDTITQRERGPGIGALHTTHYTLHTAQTKRARTRANIKTLTSFVLPSSMKRLRSW